MKQVIISHIEEKDNGITYYRARLLENGNLLDGNVKFPRNFRMGDDKIGNVYDLKNQNVHAETSKKGKKSWRASPQNKDPIPIKKFINCNSGKYCSILPCNCMKKTG